MNYPVMLQACKNTLALSILALCTAQAAIAQKAADIAPRLVENPLRLEMQRMPAPRLLTEKASPGKLQAAAPLTSREATLDLNVVYTNGTIWNPATRRMDAVRLRSYQGTRVNPNGDFVSPMIEIEPGDTIRVNLNNQLPADPNCAHQPSADVNTPHCFNGTNLHTHGLWVNPAGNSDNVLISIDPGVKFQYEYNIPSDHPAGTFWYHTHRHGSTALQVSSGMAGALVIRGKRLPDINSAGTVQPGDLDTLLQATPAQSFKERVLVMQQIQYACRDATGAIKLNPDQTYRCDPGDVGAIEGINGGPSGYDLFGPGSWPASGRYTTINGLVLPTFANVRTGQIERWRMIHGGVRDTINLQFRKLKANAPSAEGVTAAAQDAFIGQHCTGEPLPQHLVASDGLTLGAIIKSSETVYQPAYRWDSLMVFPESGTYCVIDAAAPAAASVGQNAPSRQLLGIVAVAPGKPVPSDITSYITNELIAAAAVNMPANVRNQVSQDLRNGLQLSRFIPHRTIADKEVTGKQELVFNIDLNTTPIQFQVNGKPFAPGRIDRVLKLGGVDEWTLSSDFVSHPYHIHVNPFQVVKILDPSGKDVSGPDAVDNSGGTVDPQYRGLKGVWKDTLWVKNNTTQGKPDTGKYTVVVRTRYRRYIGDFVLHCHILDHEDQGMMQTIRVALPDGAGGVSQGHHH